MAFAVASTKGRILHMVTALSLQRSTRRGGSVIPKAVKVELKARLQRLGCQSMMGGQTYDVGHVDGERRGVFERWQAFFEGFDLSRSFHASLLPWLAKCYYRNFEAFY